MPNLVLAFNLLSVLFLALFGGLIAKKLRQPLLLGYVLSGIIFGGPVMKLMGSQGFIDNLAEIGVALLMFSLGIEFSFTKLLRVKRIAIWGGLIQILGTILWGLLIFPALGFDFYPSLFLASCFSLSSTAVVTKILFEKGELDTLPGEIMIGLLLIQDLAVLPMILILPQISSLSILGLGQLLASILKSTTLLTLTIVLGRQILPKILARVAAVNSREILVLVVVTLCLLFAFATNSLGLSFALGAFFAGLLIADSAQNHAVFSEIRPLRDLFSIIFFVSLGMVVTPSFLAANFPSILILATLVVMIKFLIISTVILYLGYHFKIAFLVGLSLVQVGEFSFILSRAGLSQNIISHQIYSLIISVALLTIIMTPFFMSWAPKIYLWLKKFSLNRLPSVHRFISGVDHLPDKEELFLERHIVICGYGRVGGWLGRALMLCQVPFVVVDYDHAVVRDLRDKGVPVVYGDPADIDVLDYAQVDRAKTIVIAIPDRHTQELVITNALSLNPKINIICRIHHQEDRGRIKTLGVQTIIQPEFEASLSILHRVIQDLGFSKEEITEKIKRVKLEYGMG